jgi:exosortase/archaeosortase family protein
MLAFFMGELARLRLAARFFLLLAGLLLAFVLNLVRTLTLTGLTAWKGATAAEGWHDSLGWAILAVLFFALYGGSKWLEKRWTEGTATPSRKSLDQKEGRFVTIKPSWVLGLAVWLVLVEAGTEWWYRRHDPAEAFKWAELQFKPGEPWKVGPVSERIQSTLACTSATFAESNLAGGEQWWVYTVNWARGAGGNVSAYFHTPEVCLPNAGVELIRKEEPFHYKLGNELLAQDVYLFQRGRQPMYVFFGRRVESTAPDTMTMEDRFNRALTGRRLLASQIMETAISGVSTRAEAEAQYSQFLSDRLSFRQ